MLVLLLSFILTGSLYAQVDRGTGVPVEALPDEFKDMEIKDYFVPTKLKRVGVIHALVGNVVVIHRDTKKAFFGKAGDYIHENDSINTLAKSRCRLRFFDENIINMAENTRFAVESFVDQRKLGKKRSLFSMLKGRAMFYAMRLFRYKDSRFNVKTPTAIVGVRGTKFAMHVYRVGEEKSADAGIKVADSGNEIGRYLAQLGTGGTETIYTDAICYEGIIDVDGVPLERGQMFIGKTREVVIAPPEVLKEFEKDTEVVTEEEKKLKEKEKKEEVVEEEAAVADTGEEPAQESSAEQSETQTDTVQQQTGSQTEEKTTVTQECPSTHQGYFSGMLVNTETTDYLAEVFASKSRQDFDAASVRAHGVQGPETDYIEAQGGSPVYHNPYARKAVYSNGSIYSEALGTTHPITDVDLGYNSYQEWGYWTMTKAFQMSDGYDYYFDNKGYYIYGDPTPDATVSGFHGTASYSGNAWGTYFCSETGTDMTGTFNASVNFDTDSITDFNLSVASGDNSRKATIENATGFFSSSHFTLSGGRWTLTPGGTVSDYSGAGSLYGPNGQYIGGAWGMYLYSTQGANGIFQGSKQ